MKQNVAREKGDLHAGWPPVDRPHISLRHQHLAQRMGSDGQSGAPGLQFSESERFVEEAKVEPERPSVEIHDGRNCIVIS
jgi:hypothetical protein